MAVAGFAVALVHFGDDYLQACDVRAEGNSAYAAIVEDDAGTPGGLIRLTIVRNGQPVDGARACLTVHRADRPYVEVSGRGREAVGPGTYEFPLRLNDAGRWVGRVVVFDEEARPVAVPISFMASRSIAPG